MSLVVVVVFFSTSIDSSVVGCRSSVVTVVDVEVVELLGVILPLVQGFEMILNLTNTTTTTTQNTGTTNTSNQYNCEFSTSGKFEGEGDEVVDGCEVGDVVIVVVVEVEGEIVVIEGAIFDVVGDMYDD